MPGASDWPAVTEAFQSVISDASLVRLWWRNSDAPGIYRTPLEVFTGHKPLRPLIRALAMHRYRSARTADEARARSLIRIGYVQEALEAMHKKVQGLTSASRKRQVDRHNKRTNVHCARFVHGDFFLVRQAQPGRHKLQFVWRGPRRISSVRSDWMFEVENLITNKKEVVHARRLHTYREK